MREKDNELGGQQKTIVVPGSSAVEQKYMDSKHKITKIKTRAGSDSIYYKIKKNVTIRIIRS